METEPTTARPSLLGGHIEEAVAALQRAENFIAGQSLRGRFTADMDHAAAIATARGELIRLHETLIGIANADTHYPSMPSGFSGDWRVLRDEARAVLAMDDLGVWS